MKLFVDMDGVLTDFVTAAMRLFGFIYVEEIYPIREAEVSRVIGVSDAELWAAIDRDANFWHTLNKFDWADDLIALVEEYDPQFTIASSPGADPASPYGKAFWLRHHYKLTPKRYMLGSQKHLLAAPGRVLIDDSDAKCQAFTDAGGVAIVFPQPWNSAHEETVDRMAWVRQCLENVKRPKGCPYPSHAIDCDCDGEGGDR